MDRPTSIDEALRDAAQLGFEPYLLFPPIVLRGRRTEAKAVMLDVAACKASGYFASGENIRFRSAHGRTLPEAIFAAVHHPESGWGVVVKRTPRLPSASTSLEDLA